MMSTKQRPSKRFRRSNLTLIIVKVKNATLVRGTYPSIVILEANDIVFAQVFTILDFD
jgi:hypothetical protein